MSYILDALKRAEAERERGTVPGLYARPVVSYNEVDDASSSKGWWLVAAALVLAAAGAAFWWWRAATPMAPAPTPVSEPAPVAKAAVAQAPVAMADLPPTQSIARTAPAEVVSKATPPVKTPAPSTTAAALQTMPQPAPAQPAKAPALAATPVPVPAPVALAKPTLPPAPPPPVTTATSPARLAPVAPGSGIPMLSELPDALRKQIPPLTIAGAVYSDDPSQRLLLVNNQAFGQGNSVAPGVQLEEIQANSSVFNFHGTRFQLDH
jgi:general secretion pathway protein B